MSEVGDDFKEYRASQKERRAKRLPIRHAEILALKLKGYDIEKKSDYHFRINKCLDVWPIHNRWHDIKNDRRGGYKSITIFVDNFFKEK